MKVTTSNFKMLQQHLMLLTYNKKVPHFNISKEPDRGYEQKS